MISFVTAISDKECYHQFWADYRKKHPEHQYVEIYDPVSMPTAYNEGLKKSKFDYICFAHQDCKIVSTEFDTYVLNMFAKYPKTGAIFMVGSPISGPDSWSFGGLDLGAGSFFDITEDNLRILPLHGDRRILVGDGYCFMTRVKEIKFDEAFRTFHFYDVIYSRELVDAGYHLMVPGKPLTYHRSPGRKGSREWKKWKSKLRKRLGKKIYVLCENGKIVICNSRKSARAVYFDVKN